MIVAGRSYAGFNPARREHVALLQSVLDGKYALGGFRNGDIRLAVYGDTRDPVAHRRQRAAMGRLFRRLHVRGLLAKIPRTRRWRVTPLGQQLLGTVVQLYHHGLATAA